jgi:iron(III) transport system substrate-binding protein
MTTNHRTTDHPATNDRRRSFAAGLACVLASAGMMAGTQAAAQPASMAGVVKAANTEGKLAIGIPLGQAYPKIMGVFQKAYPNIKVEAVSIHTSNFTARAQEERNNGRFLWDVFVGGPDVDLYNLGNRGAFEPTRSYILDKAILDDTKWLYGFDAGFSDSGKKYSYNFGTLLWSGAYYVNRDLIPESELKSVDDLMKNPAKFKGKIAWQDPRGSGSGVNSSAMIMEKYGEEALRNLYKSADIVVSADQRQLIEFVVRGRYPIGVGLLERELKVTFQSQGVGLNVKNIVIPGVETAIPGSNSVVVLNRAPNPNAAKVFLNWLLSQEGQAAFAEITTENSRRLDVRVSVPENMPDKALKRPPLNTQSEAFGPQRSKANAISKELLK